MGAQTLANISFAGWIAHTLETKRPTSVDRRKTAPSPLNGNGRARTDQVVLSNLAMVATDIQPDTMGHAHRAADTARGIARAMSLPGSMVDAISVGALLHDIGKSQIPAAILDKPGKLSDSEWDQIKQHPDIGYQMLRDTPGLEEVATIVRHHHERYDGGGYPAGLAGEAIPLGARIIAVSDAFDAMRSERSYKAALSLDEAVAELRQHAGKQFDPVVVDTFLKQVLQAAPY